MNIQPAIECAIPDSPPQGEVSLAHGDGGRMTRELIEQHILSALANQRLATLGDAAILPRPGAAPAFSTDSFVVSPLEFPGGDIGSLAVFGTANDLAVSGARPRWLSLSLIIEEGFPLARLDRLLASAAAAARDIGVEVVTGDTKVVPRGAADGLFINTAGLGEQIMPLAGPAGLTPGDVLLVSGPIGCHGVAILAAREGLKFDPTPHSDCGPLWPAVEALLSAEIPVKAMRDATRGGLAAVLHEWATASKNTLMLESAQVPVTPEVRGACELLGLDPIHLACENAMAIAVSAAGATSVLSALRQSGCCPQVAIIGEVIAPRRAPVVIRSALGQLVALDEPCGAPLPRIC